MSRRRQRYSVTTSLCHYVTCQRLLVTTSFASPSNTILQIVSLFIGKKSGEKPIYDSLSTCVGPKYICALKWCTACMGILFDSVLMHNRDYNIITQRSIEATPPSCDLIIVMCLLTGSYELWIVSCCDWFCHDLCDQSCVLSAICPRFQHFRSQLCKSQHGLRLSQQPST